MTSIFHSQNNCFQSWHLILFRHQSCRNVEDVFRCDICCMHNGLTIVQVILSHECCWFHRYSQKHYKSQNVLLHLLQHWKLFSVFFALDHSPNSRMILILLTNLILLHRFQWRIVEAILLLENRYRVSLDCHEALPQSQRIARFHHDAILVRETKSNFSCRSPWSFIGSNRLLVHLSISFPLLRRPSTVIIPLWVACWRETFHDCSWC